jgi:hypothetical protein
MALPFLCPHIVPPLFPLELESLPYKVSRLEAKNLPFEFETLKRVSSPIALTENHGIVYIKFG